jgi:transposase
VKGADILIGETTGMKQVISPTAVTMPTVSGPPCANRARSRSSQGGRNRKRPIQYDERRYKDRWRVEAMFCRLNDFRRIATRYDKLARNFLSAVSLAAAVAFGL